MPKLLHGPARPYLDFFPPTPDPSDIIFYTYSLTLSTWTSLVFSLFLQHKRHALPQGICVHPFHCLACPSPKYSTCVTITVFPKYLSCRLMKTSLITMKIPSTAQHPPSPVESCSFLTYFSLQHLPSSELMYIVLINLLVNCLPDQNVNSMRERVFYFSLLLYAQNLGETASK